MIQDFIDILNRLLEIDPVATQRMLDEGKIHSIELGNADYARTKGIVIYVDKAYTYMSMLGVINSVLRKHNKNDLIMAVYDNNGKLIKFGHYGDIAHGRTNDAS